MIKISGSLYGLSFYQMDGKGYVRSKSSLTREQVLKNDCFAPSREWAGLLGAASTLASKLYCSCPPPLRNRNIYQQLTGRVMRLLQSGYSAEEVLADAEQFPFLQMRADREKQL